MRYPKPSVDAIASAAIRNNHADPKRRRNASINRDSNLRLQYLAGLGLNLYQADTIYSEMLRYVSKVPEDLFIGSETTKHALFAAINRAQGR